MNKHSVSLALDMCVVALGHLKGMNPGHSLFDRQCKIAPENEADQDYGSKLNRFGKSIDDSRHRFVQYKYKKNR